MASLLLLRHARAAWAEPGMRDFDRPLDMAGRIDADAMGAVLAISGAVPDLVVCSGARRARETWDAVAKHLHPTCQAISPTNSMSLTRLATSTIVRIMPNQKR
jgi:phosphohistidine phosphatase SixA